MLVQQLALVFSIFSNSVQDLFVREVGLFARWI